MLTSGRYPLVDEKSRLPRPVRRWRGWWQDPSVLPEVPPGAVLVFHARDRYDVVDGDRLTGYEDVLLDAVDVGVVDCRPRTVTVDVPVSSIGQAYAFPVKVTFDVRVTDPTAVFRHGISNLRGGLHTALCRDEQLVKFNDRFDIDELVSARAAICAYVMSAYGQRPPHLDGVRVGFQTVTVETPGPMLTHATTMQGLRWAGTEETLRQGQERQRVDHLGALMRTPQQARELAVARGDMTVAEAARIAADEEQREIEMLLAEVRRMDDSGEAHRDAVDRRHLLQRLDRHLTRSEPPQALPRAREPRQPLPGVGDEPSVYIPSDDDDDD